MNADTFFMNVERYGVLIPICILIIFILIFYYIFRHHIYSLIKTRAERRKRIQNQDYQLNLRFGLSSIASFIPLALSLVLIFDPRFVEFFSRFYKRNIEYNIVLGSALLLLILFLPFIFLWIKFSLKLIYRQIQGFISYSFLALWFRLKKKKYTQEKYKIFLKNCISWSKKEIPSLSEFSKKRYNSPIAMVSYLETKAFLKRNHTFKSFAKNELRKMK